MCGICINKIFVVKKCKITCPCSKQQNYFFTQPSTDPFWERAGQGCASPLLSAPTQPPPPPRQPRLFLGLFDLTGSLSVRGRSCPLPARRSEAGSDPASQLYSFSDLLTATTQGCFFLLTRQKYFLFAFLGTVSLV